MMDSDPEDRNPFDYDLFFEEIMTTPPLLPDSPACCMGSPFIDSEHELGPLLDFEELVTPGSEMAEPEEEESPPIMEAETEMGQYLLGRWRIE